MIASPSNETTRPRPSRNWWKAGFFVLLFLLEGAREWIVAFNAEPPKIATSLHVGRVGTLVSATGRWTRIDDGSNLLPGAVRITCWQHEARCYETSYNILNGYSGTPNLDVFDATFSEDAVVYENDNPDCARYRVRIDLSLEKVFARRDRKESPLNSNCAGLEKKVEMTLGDGFEPYDPTDNHFLPFVWILRTALGN